MAKIKYIRGKQLLPKAIKILLVPGMGFGYFYGDHCFAYVWATRVFSKAWWANLLFMADCDPQEALRCAEDRQRRSAGRKNAAPEGQTKGESWQQPK